MKGVCSTLWAECIAAGLPVLGDWNFLMRFLQRFDIGVVPERLANYHHRVPSDKSAYSNSIHAGAARHRHYWAMLRNEMLRADLEQGKIGVGHLVNDRREGGSLEHVRRIALIGKALLGLKHRGVETLAIFGGGTAHTWFSPRALVRTPCTLYCR